LVSPPEWRPRPWVCGTGVAAPWFWAAMPPPDPALGQSLCCGAVGTLFGMGKGSRPTARTAAAAPEAPTAQSAGSTGDDQEALRSRVEDFVLGELRTLQEKMSKELNGAIERLSKADASENKKDSEGRRELPLAFKVGRERAANDDIVDSSSPRALRRNHFTRRFTATADGKESLAEILKHSAVVGVGFTPVETAENSSSDESSSKASSRPPTAQKEISGGRKKLLHARIEERLNEVHQHQVEERDTFGEELHHEEANSQASTPSCSSTTWRVDALDLGDRLAADAAAKKGSASIESIINLVQTERDRWATEKQGLEAKLEELKEKLRSFDSPPDTECESLKRRVAELRQTIKARSRFGAWVCDRHMQESDEEDEESEKRNADKEALRIQLQQVEAQLRDARRKATLGVPSSDTAADGQPGDVEPRSGASGSSEP